MERTTPEQYIQELPSLLFGEGTITKECIYDNITVVYSNDCNVDYCTEHNIPCYYVAGQGGCLVNMPGNITIADFRSNSAYWIYAQCLKDFVTWLIQEKELKQVGIDHNDILVDGYKVASGFGFNIAPNYTRMYTGINISIDVDIELIRAICTKPMIKEPKGLSNWGIASEECAEWIENWFTLLN